MKKYLLLLFLGVILSFHGHSQGLTNVGTDFWIAFPPNSGVFNLQIFVSSNFSTSGNVSSAFPGVNQAFTVVPGVLTLITIPVGVTLAGGIENKGIRVTALNPVSVYGLNPAIGTTDAYLALPVTSLGTDYRVMTYKTTLASNGSCFSVVAIQNGTVLTIFNHQTGGTSNINLNRF